METELENFKKIINDYFKRLSIITTQVPNDLRPFLLPAYMLYKGYKSVIYVDPKNKIGFEVLREKASRLSIKLKRTKALIEEEIFGTFGQENMFRTDGKTQISGIVLTCKEFSERYSYLLPQVSSVLVFSKNGYIGPLEVGENAELKLIDIGIYWLVKGRKKFIKKIPFAWIFGNKDLLLRVDSFTQADSDFYNSLFSRIYYIITDGYETIIKGQETLVDKSVILKVVNFYTKLIKKVKEEFDEILSLTKADEYIFQKLLEKYNFFLYPSSNSLIESQPSLQAEITRKPDFCIHVGDKEDIYVEIEPPFYKPFRGHSHTHRLKEALKQVLEWRDILERKGIQKRTRYLIIIGLVEDLTKEEREALLKFNKSRKDLTVATWDYITENINKVENEVRRLLYRNR